MALARLTRDSVYRWRVASPLAFDDWENPTAAELNANPTNDPHGLIFDPTCVLNQDGTTFDLDDPETDDSLSFCQKAGDTETMAYNPNVVLEGFRSRQPWTNAASTSAADGFNSANLFHSLFAWRGVEYFIILSIGKDKDAPFAVGDKVSLVRVATDWGIDQMGTGEAVRLSNDTASRSDVNWNYTITA